MEAPNAKLEKRPDLRSGPSSCRVISDQRSADPELADVHDHECTTSDRKPPKSLGATILATNTLGELAETSDDHGSSVLHATLRRGGVVRCVPSSSGRAAGVRRPASSRQDGRGPVLDIGYAGLKSQTYASAPAGLSGRGTDVLLEPLLA